MAFQANPVIILSPSMWAPGRVAWKEKDAIEKDKGKSDKET